MEGAASGDMFAVENPATGEVIAKVADGGRADARRAIDAAERALAGWSALTAYERCAS
jgi:succinate-semialdehyde dehydrogenase/glutarate-semialdehyde dehydrogenase